MKNFKNVSNMIKTNFWSLLGFELIFKLLSLLIFTPLFLGLFNLVMNITGYNYLTLENIIPFLCNYKTIIMLLILIILMTMYTMFDITTIIILLDSSYHHQKMRAVDAIKLSLKKCYKILFPTNILLAFLVLFLIPFLSLGVASSFISTIKIPEFILEFILGNYIFIALLTIALIILTIILLRWIYALHYFVLEDLNFLKAKKKSINLSRKSHLKDILIILLVELLSVIFYFIFVILGILLIIFINDICDIIWLKSFTTTIIWVFIAISFLFQSALSTPISYAAISSLFYYRKTKIGEEIKVPEPKEEDEIKLSPKIKKAICIFIILAIIGGSIFTYGLNKGKFNINIEYSRNIEVTAHRGASQKYPENTMSAFKGAKELGADWIELDVAQTKDGYIVVTHDTNFKRTAGVDKNVWDLTLKEVKKLDVGSFFNKKFKGERVPTLEEVIIFAKENNMKLNIELKPTGKETDFEQKVIDIIIDNDFDKDCVITSQVYEVLEQVKKYNKDIKTVYVMSLAYGNIIDLKYADHFSIEATSVTSSLVSKVHKEGKELYAWTVNTKESIMNMIDLKVDNIITDDITLARDTIMSSKRSDLISEYIKFVEDLLK